jgi:hypothetical protein
MARSSSTLDRAAAFYENAVPPIHPLVETWRHGHWKKRRCAVYLTLERAGFSPRVLERFAQCGSDAHVLWSESEQRHRISGSYCKNRHCDPCMRAKAQILAANIRDRATGPCIGRYRFTTLTLRHSDQDLVQQVKRLYACFRTLRRRPVWRTQKGGCFTLEVKRGQDGRWHPHLHVISEGHFMPQADLSREWDKVTGGSHIVDVRTVRDARGVSVELSKYIAKSTSADVWFDPQASVEWVLAVKGVRSCATFGTWRGWKLLQPPADPKDWVHVDTLVSLIRRAQAGEVHARQLLISLRPPGIGDDTS